METHERHINLARRTEQMAGVYANFTNRSDLGYEFSITSLRLDHEGSEGERLQGVVVSHVSTSARFVKKLMDAIQDNYGKWLADENIRNLPKGPGRD